MRLLTFPRPHLRLLTYLACPYSHERSDIREYRFNCATAGTKFLMQEKKWNVFSPITHSHPLHVVGMRGDWSFWKKIDTQYLQLSRRLVVLTLPGWQTSVGVNAEIVIARKMGIPIYYLGCEQTLSGIRCANLRRKYDVFL